MIRSEKKLKELNLIVSEENSVKVTEAIESLRDEEPHEGVIGLLISFYDRSDNSSIRRVIKEFLNDMKDSSACKEVIAEIKKDWKADTINMLVSSCWQSGLDYSDYSADLAKVFLAGDYLTAIECFTVIEESVQKISREKKDEIIKIIREDSHSGHVEKTVLTLELISILS